MVTTSESTRDDVTASSGSAQTDKYRAELGVLAHVLAEAAADVRMSCLACWNSFKTGC